MSRKSNFILFFLLFTFPLFSKTFPLCMYGVDHPADVPLLKKAGFTCLQSYQKEPEQLVPLARAAAKYGLQVVFHPQQVIGSAYQQQAQQWPVLAWYIVDEPDVWGWSRARVQAAQQQTREAFPAHRQTLVIGQGKTAVPYYDLPDYLLVDWYPVPHLPLTSFGDNVRWAKEGQAALGAADKPLWGVVQIFDWKEYKQHRPDDQRIGRFPTEQEIRFMAYDAIANGAEGLFFFIFTTNGTPLPAAQPEWWKRVRNVSKELARLRPVLENGLPTENPVTVQNPLQMRTYLYKNVRYVLLLNRSAEPVAVPAPLLGKAYKILFPRKKTASLSPYDVWVLKTNAAD